MASPIPLAPPVTTATFPSMTRSLSIYGWLPGGASIAVMACSLANSATTRTYNGYADRTPGSRRSSVQQRDRQRHVDFDQVMLHLHFQLDWVRKNERLMREEKAPAISGIGMLAMPGIVKQIAVELVIFDLYQLIDLEQSSQTEFLTRVEGVQMRSRSCFRCDLDFSFE
jgi:hypothetical protein